MRYTAGDIADQLGGKVLGDRTMPLTGFQSADRACAENQERKWQRVSPV